MTEVTLTLDTPWLITLAVLVYLACGVAYGRVVYRCFTYSPYDPWDMRVMMGVLSLPLWPIFALFHLISFCVSYRND